MGPDLAPSPAAQAHQQVAARCTESWTPAGHPAWRPCSSASPLWAPALDRPGPRAGAKPPLRLSALWGSPAGAAGAGSWLLQRPGYHFPHSLRVPATPDIFAFRVLELYTVGHQNALAFLSHPMSEAFQDAQPHQSDLGCSQTFLHSGRASCMSGSTPS